MRRVVITGLVGGILLAGCNQSAPQNQQPTQAQPQNTAIGPEQAQLHQLDALNLAIALKRAIYDSGYSCKRIDKEGYVGRYKNLDEWTAHCAEGRDFAIFAGPDGSAQVRDCVDVVRFGLPKCEIMQAPKGSLTAAATRG